MSGVIFVLMTLMTSILPASASTAWAAPLEIRAFPATTKVLKGDLPGEALREVALEAAGNEWVAFQVAITATDARLDAVTVALSDLEGPEGAVLPASNVTLYREYFIEITEPSWCESPMSPSCEDHPEYLRKPGWYPDALIPFLDPYDNSDTPRRIGAPFDVAVGDRQVVFADLFVPAGTPPGIYRGNATVSDANGPIDTLPVALQVWDFDLPLKRSMATAYGFGTGELLKYHGGPEGGDADTRARILRNYEFEAHRHRMDFTHHNPGVNFTFDDNGNLEPPDFTAYDAYIGPRIDGSYYPDGAGINRYNLGMFRPGKGLGSMTESQWAEAAKAMAEHLDDKGWLDHVYLYSSDEPWLPSHLVDGSIQRIHQDVGRLRAASDLWKGHVMVTGPWWDELDGDVDIWCPVTPMYGDVYWPAGVWWGRDEYARHVQAGGELWFYVCNANFPAMMGYDLDSDIGHEPRLTKWGAWYEGATGFLYWRMTYWQNPDPWHDVANVEGFGVDYARNGDGILLYPGDADGTLGPDLLLPWPGFDGPVVSLRMKQIRDGLEDWELLLMADALGGRDYARAQVDTVYRAFGAPLDYDFDSTRRPWSMDDRPVLEARARIAEKVQYLTHPDRYDDPEVPVAADPTDTAEGVLPDAMETQDARDESDAQVPDVQGDQGTTDPTSPDVPTVTDLAVSDSGTSTGKSSGCNAAPSAGPGWLALFLLMIPLVMLRISRAR
jgi:hypothetical protein